MHTRRRCRGYLPSGDVGIAVEVREVVVVLHVRLYSFGVCIQGPQFYSFGVFILGVGLPPLRRIHMYVYSQTYIYIHTYIYIYIYIYMCVYIYICVCTNTTVYSFFYYIYIYLYIYKYLASGVVGIAVEVREVDLVVVVLHVRVPP